MDPIIFESVTQETDQIFGVTLVLFLISAAASMCFLIIKTDRIIPRYRTLLALFFFIMALVTGGTAGFSKLTSRKLGSVEMGADYLLTPYGRTNIDQIRNAYIEMDRKPSLFNPGQGKDRVRLLFVIEKDGKTHVLSEENYPIQAILNTLKANINAKSD